MFYNTLKLNHIILYHIWYLQHDKLPFYIYSTILPILISACRKKFSHYKTCIYSITVYYNTLKHNRIILYHIWYLQHDKLPLYIYSRILPVLISACRNKFSHYKRCIYSITVFYNTLKHNRIILYHIWYLLHDEPTVYIYSRTLPVLFQHAALNLIPTRREFTLFQYSITLSSIIASFCIIFDICSMMNQQCYIYSRILPVLISTCCIEFTH